MAQIIDRPGTGELLGRALGTGLGSGLQSLAQQKMQQMQKANLATLFGGVQGVSPQEALLASQLPTSALGPFLKSKFAQPAMIEKKYSPFLKQVKAQGEIGSELFGDIKKLQQLHNDFVKAGGSWLDFSKTWGHKRKEYDTLVSSLTKSQDPFVRRVAAQLKDPTISDEARKQRINMLGDRIGNYLSQHRAAEEVLAQFGGNTPPHFDKLVAQRMNQYKNDDKEQFFEEITPSSQEEGEEIETPSGQTLEAQTVKEEMPQTQEPVVDPRTQIGDFGRQFAESSLGKTLQEASEASKDIPYQIAVRGAKGITGLPHLINQGLNLVSAGKIPVSQYLEKLKDLPAGVIDTLLTLGDKLTGGKGDLEFKGKSGIGGVGLGEAAALFTPGGVLKLIGKTAQGVNGLAKVGQYIGTLGKALGTSPQTALKISAAGNIPGYLAKKIGVGEQGQAAANIGGTLAYLFMGKTGAEQLLKNVEKDVESLLPTGDILLKEIWKDSPNKKIDFGNIKNVGQYIQKATQHNPQLKTALNEYHSLNNSIESGSKIHQFLKSSGNRRLRQGLLPGIGLVIGGAPGKLATKAGILAGAGTIGAGLGQLEKTGRLLYGSAPYRKYFAQFLQAALRHSIPETEKALTKLDAIVAREEKNKFKL